MTFSKILSLLCPPLKGGENSFSRKIEMEVEDLIKALNLKPLPQEGGFFRVTYRACGILPGGERNLSTAIFFLLTSDNFSTLHQIPQDEIFHFYLGDPVEMIQIDLMGELKKIQMGPCLLEGEQVQDVVPGSVWRGLRLVEGGQWVLLGTTVAPGFDFRDFVKGDRKELLEKFPRHKTQILRFTRENE